MSITKEKNYYATPQSILSDPKLHAYSKLIYPVILSTSQFHEGVYTDITNSKIQELTAIPISGITKGIKDLADRGYIEVIGSNHTRTIKPLVQIMGKDVKPQAVPRALNAEQHSLLDKYLKVWGAKVTINGKPNCKAGVSHRLSGVGKSQGKNVWRMFQYLEETNQGILSFYNKHKDKLNSSWKEKHHINTENIKLSKVTLKKALRTHLNLLQAGVKEEGGYKLPDSFEDFFIQKIVIEGKEPVYRSWLLYWVTKDISLQQKQSEKESIKVEPLYDPETYMNGKFKSLYRKIPKDMFKHNRNTSIKASNDVTRYIDSIVTLLSPYYAPDVEKEKNLKGLSISLFADKLKEYFTDSSWDELRAKILETDISQCHIKGKNWDNFIDSLKQDPLISLRWKKNCHLLKNNT